MVERVGIIRIVVGCLVSLALTPALAQADPPARVAGLTAWYRIDSLHARLRDGATVERWNDDSRLGHKLTGTWEDHAPPSFNVKKLNDRPVVRIGENTVFAVTDPFELEDHTIFLVFASDFTKRALFSSDGDRQHGVILGQDGQSHFYQNGKEGLFPYNRATRIDRNFTVTVLGREEGLLRAFVNGVDISSYAEMTAKIRVGHFFDLKHTTFVGSDGEGLQIAEMIFYDRFLTDVERVEITGYLAQKYGIAIETAAVDDGDVEQGAAVAIDDEAVLVRLGTGFPGNLNVERVAIEWDSPVAVSAPFAFDVEQAGSELHCRKDGTLVRLSVILPMRAKIEKDDSEAEKTGAGVESARIRVLILKNGEEYLPPLDAWSGPFLGPEGKSSVRFRTTVKLDAGEFVEIVAIGDTGTEATVTLVPGETFLIVERIE